jgi:hypothetical protein
MAHLTKTEAEAGYDAARGLALAKPLTQLTGVQILLGGLSILLGVWAIWDRSHHHRLAVLSSGPAGSARQGARSGVTSIEVAASVLRICSAQSG